MIVARSSGRPIDAASERSTGSASVRTAWPTTPSGSSGGSTTVTMVRSAVSRSRTSANLARKSWFSTMATTAPQWFTRYSTWSADDEL